MNNGNTEKKGTLNFFSVTFNSSEDNCRVQIIKVTLKKKIDAFFSVLHLIDTTGTYYK